jgi:hypothetical protein
VSGWGVDATKVAWPGARFRDMRAASPGAFVPYDPRSPEPDSRRGSRLGTRTNEPSARLDVQTFAGMGGSAAAAGRRGSRLCSRRMRGRESIQPIRVCGDVADGCHGPAGADG